MSDLPALDRLEADVEVRHLPWRRPVGWYWRLLVLLAIGLAIGYGGQMLSYRLWLRPANLSLIWIPGGVLMGALLLLPRRDWWPLALAAGVGGMAALMAWRGSFVAALSLYVVNVGGLVVVAHLLRRGGERVRVFNDIQALSTYFLFAVLLLPAIAAWASALVAHFGGYRKGGVLAIWLTMAPSLAMSYLVTTPLLLAVAERWRSGEHRAWPARLEFVLLASSLLAVSFGLWKLVSSTEAIPLLLFGPAPLLILLALRFGSLGAATGLALVAFACAWSGIYRPLEGRSAGEQVSAHTIQLWLLATGFLLHALAVLSQQQRSVQALLDASHRHIRSLAGRLLKSQEEERSRLARELHDGVNQQIASLAISVSSLKRLSADPVASGLEELHLSMVRLADDVRRISHNLHPSYLEHVGLGHALGEMIRMKGEQWDGEIHYEWDDRTARPAPEATVCLYRIAQEALRNAIAHSGARNIRVHYQMKNGGFGLVVEDDGRGFELEQIFGSGGLGLLSMRERATLVGGQVTVDSTPGAGTRIGVWIPSKDAR